MKKGIISVLSVLGGAAAGAAVVGKKMGFKIHDRQELADKHLALFLMMNQWVKVKQEGKHLADYFEQNGYKEIAVYGMSYAGETLVEELRGSNITVKYGIDKKAEKIYADINMITPEEELDCVDAIVVTSITFIDEIEKKLSQKISCPIISLEDILYQI